MTNKNNQIVWTGKVASIFNIENADFLESAVVDCGDGGIWSGVVKKGAFKSGDLCNAFLQDAIVPKDLPGLGFMEKSKWRVRMARFRGAPSECLITENFSLHTEFGIPIGDELGAEKYEKPIPVSMAGLVKGNFPAFISKTDETNFQSARSILAYLATTPVYISTKYDGSSCTVYNRSGEFGVCSRNLDLKDDGKNVFWRVAKALCLDEKLPDNYAVQMEVYGEGIQKNPLGVGGVTGAIFNVYHITSHEYLDFEDMIHFCEYYDLSTVEILHSDFLLESDDDEYLRGLAEGTYSNGNQREGIVIRPMKEARVEGHRASIKVINLKYRD